MWRIVTSKDMKDGLADIRSAWTFADLFEAQVVLDVLETLRPDRED